MQTQLRVIKQSTYSTSLQLTQQPGNMAPNLLKVEGYYEGGTQAWLQFFDSLGAPANGTVPLYEESLGTVAPNGFSWQFKPGIIIRLNNVLDSAPLVSGLVICISTTQGALTIGTGSNLSSFYVALEEWELLPGVTVTKEGDTTSVVTNLTAWADGTFHTLDKVIFSNTGATPAFLKLFTSAPVQGVSLPLQQWPIIANQALTELNFRGQGYVPQTQDTTVTPPVIHNGGIFKTDTQSGVYTANFISATIQVNFI